MSFKVLSLCTDSIDTHSTSWHQEILLSRNNLKTADKSTNGKKKISIIKQVCIYYKKQPQLGLNAINTLTFFETIVSVLCYNKQSKDQTCISY